MPASEYHNDARPVHPSTECIGLFGTCGTSTWRQAFMLAYDHLAIPYYNPQVSEWTPDRAQVEAHHLVNDDIVLFPITGETYGTGSLAETGFPIAQVLGSLHYPQSHRKVIVYIEQALDATLMASNPLAAKESMRARALVAAHLNHVQDHGVYVVHSLQEMMALSIKLYPAVQALRHACEAQHTAQHRLAQVWQEHRQSRHTAAGIAL